MRTYKPISTISYNSKAFLETALCQLEELEKISFWCICFHLGDKSKDEKDHFHVYLEPIQTIDTESDWFREAFLEKIEGEEKPRGVMPWRKSNFSDWYLYAKHDSAYLRAKFG